jgi:hypothetical protein
MQGQHSFRGVNSAGLAGQLKVHKSEIRMSFSCDLHRAIRIGCDTDNRVSGIG